MTLLSAASRLSRTLPPSRAKVRAGRAVTSLVVAFGADPVCTTRLQDGSRLRLDLRSRTEAGAFWEGVYEQDYVRLIGELAGAYGNVVYDVGANVGLVAVPVARALAPGGLVVAFEPVQVNFDRLRENVSLNGLHAAVTAYCTALGSEDGTVSIAREAGHGAATGNAVLMAGGDAGSRDEVSTVPLHRLDHLVDRDGLPGPDVVKVDVEGAEVAWLLGSQRVLATSRPVVLGEFNSDLMPRFGTTFLDVPALLPDDYEVFSFLTARSVVRRRPEVGLGDVLLVPTEKVAALPVEVVA